MVALVTLVMPLGAQEEPGALPDGPEGPGGPTPVEGEDPWGPLLDEWREGAWEITPEGQEVLSPLPDGVTEPGADGWVPFEGDELFGPLPDGFAEPGEDGWLPLEGEELFTPEPDGLGEPDRGMTPGGPDAFAPLPSGFSASPGGGGTPLSDLVDGWSFGASSSVYYDSNAQRGSGGALDPVEDDLVLSLTPRIAYRTVGGDWYFGASGSFGWIHHFQTEPADGYNIAATLQGGYEGPKLKVGATLNYGYNKGYNRYYGNEYIAQHSLSLGVSGSYRLSPRTSLTSSLNLSGLAPSKDFTGDTQNYGANFGVRWRASPLVNLDGGLGYTLQSGDLQADRQTLGPYIGGSYRLRKKLSFNARVGFDYVDNGGSGGSDFFMPVRLSVNYEASSLWGMDLSVFRDESGNGGAGGGYRERYGVRAGYHRRIRRTQLQLGVSYEQDELDDPSRGPGGMDLSGGDGDYLNLDASLSMPVFHNRANASIFTRYSNEDGSDGREWDGYQVGMSLSVNF